MFDKFKQKLYLFKRKLKYLLNPGLELKLKRRAEKLLGGKVVETTDTLYGIRPEDCIPKNYKAENSNVVKIHNYTHWQICDCGCRDKK